MYCGNRYSYERKTRENWEGETETYVDETVTPNYEQGELTYIENRESRSVTVAGTIRILEVATRSQVASWSFNEEAQDEVEYITDFRMQHDLSADSVEIAMDPSEASGGAELGGFWALSDDENREFLDMLHELNDGAISEDRVHTLIDDSQRDRPHLANVSSLLRDGFSNTRSGRTSNDYDESTEDSEDDGFWSSVDSEEDQSREPRSGGSNEAALLTRIADRARTEILDSVEVDVDAERRRLRAPSELNLSFLVEDN